MYYNEVCGLKLSALGMGNMRLPQKDGKIDYEKAQEIIDLAYERGINYYDTAFRYHSGESEIFIGKALAKYPRESWYLASKLPGHQMHYENGKLGFHGYLSDFHVEKISEIFEMQLEKCGVDYFDFYLLHNLSETSIDFYMNPEVGVVDYLKKQKELGRIRHLGFSSHGSAETIDRFLNAYDCFEFCQIQLNYLDWTLQDAAAKYDVITKHGLAVWVMEPVRGGKLAIVDPTTKKEMETRRPGESPASWAFRFLQALPNVKMILSGMTTLDQLKDNLKTFAYRDAVSEDECAFLLEAAEKLKNLVPCTACRYCTEDCPMSLPIPEIFALYNTKVGDPNFDLKAAFSAFEPEKLPSNCIACGACARMCPQRIRIPDMMAMIAEQI